MIFVFFLLLDVIVQISSLGLIKQPPLQCSQEGVSCSVQVSRPNCLGQDLVVPRSEAPNPHPDVGFQVKIKADDRNESVPVLILTLTQLSDANIYSLQGMKVHVHEFTTDNSLCVRYSFSDFSWVQKPDFEQWSFVLDQIVVDPGLTYQVSVSNLPTYVGGHPKLRNITVPGCELRKFQSLRVCLENGSLWDPNMTWSVGDDGINGVTIEVTFNTAQFSDMYEVYVHSAGFLNEHPHIVSKDNRSIISVSFSLNPSQIKSCEIFLGVKPFFIRCMQMCSHHQQKINICSYYTIPSAKNLRMVWALLGQAALFFCVVIAVILHKRVTAIHKVLPALPSMTDPSSSSPNTINKSGLETVSVQECSKVLIIYSQDHPMYTKIVLKLCAFLRAKCATEVTLDLLDSTWLSTIGSIQWLDMQRKRLTRTTDKILILCSPGMCAKWDAMCSGRRVMTREDTRSPMGDMLTPALSLIIPEFVCATSFSKYAIAYFDDVFSENDVPTLFHVTVKYQLMKQFEELFFRLLNKEKYEPGRIKHADGLGRNDYYNCPSGKALRDAIRAFQAYQVTNPNWFEMELVNVDKEVEQE